MLTRHISRSLAAYLDGVLLAPDVRHAEMHLHKCARCRAELEQLRVAREALGRLPLVEAPAAIWTSLESALRQPGPAAFRWRMPVAAAAAFAVVAGAYWILAPRSAVSWEVLRQAGTPLVGTTPLRAVGHIAAGQWIETDAASRASIKIGVIGSVEIAPNTRLRVVTANPAEHRLALARGKIQATISAPPKLFFVETASGTAVDLGCEYTLEADEGGSGLLRVTKGWVSFQWKGLESLVPAGASCRTRPLLGPGIPYFDDAPEALKQALARFGLEKSGDDALNTILAAARIRDTLTLWHLLSRVDSRDRMLVYNRIASLTPPPAGVTRGRILELDPGALRLWREDMAWKW